MPKRKGEMTPEQAREWMEKRFGDVKENAKKAAKARIAKMTQEERSAHARLMARARTAEGVRRASLAGVEARRRKRESPDAETG